MGLPLRDDDSVNLTETFGKLLTTLVTSSELRVLLTHTTMLSVTPKSTPPPPPHKKTMNHSRMTLMLTQNSTLPMMPTTTPIWIFSLVSMIVPQLPHQS